MKTHLTPTNILMVILILVVSISWLDRKDDNKVLKEYWESLDFKTDSIKAYIDYDKLPKPEYRNYVPPAIVINYIDSTKSYKTTQVIKNDSLLLVIDSIRDEYTRISLRYIQNNPKAWKILYSDLSKDSASFDMVNLEGNTVSQRYGLNYNRFKYQLIYNNGVPTLRAQEYDEPLKEDKKLFDSRTYLSPGYLFMRGAPSVSLDYNLNYKNLRFRTDGTISIESSPQFFLKAELGYRIW